MRRRLIIVVLLAPLLAPAVRADGRDDSGRARMAVETGEIRPLAELLARVELSYGGRVIETELEQEHGRWIYEFKLLPETGLIFTVTMDAATGMVVGTHGPVRERR